MDEEAARGGPVRDDALGADAEASVGVLLIGGDPASRIATPAELGKCVVEF